MKKNRILALVLAAVLITGISLTGCAGSNTGNTAGNAKVTINLGSEPPQMNTILQTDVTSHNVDRHVFEGLTRLGKDGKPIAGIAEKWESTSDGMKWTFYLRDSKWSDGSPVTAKDFEFAFLESLKPENAAEYAYLFYMFKNGEAYNKGKAKREDVGVKATNDKTLVIELERPAPFILDLLAFGNFSPVKESYYKQQGDKYGVDADKLLYNGPWVMKTWQHEDRIVLSKNPNYWNSKNIKLDEITMLMIKDSNTALNSFNAGEVEMIGLNGSQVEQVSKAGNSVINYPDGSSWYFEFNLKDPVMSNINIRKALTYGVDRKQFISGVLKNKSVPATSFTNPVIFGEKGSFAQEVGNLLKDNDPTAKQLFQQGLKELGLTQAPKIEMIADDTDTARQQAQAYQEFWKKNLGFEVTITMMPFKARLERMTNKDFSIVIAGWGADYNDPMSFLDMFETGNGNNHTSYSDKAYDELLNKVRNEKNAKTRMDLLKQTETKLMTDLPIGPVYWRYRDYVVKPYLKDVVRQWGQDIDLYWAYIDNTQK